MRKTASILFTMFYVVVVVGVTVTVHLCGGEITSVSANPLNGQKDACGCFDGDEGDFCCHNQIEQFQLSTPHAASFAGLVHVDEPLSEILCPDFESSIPVLHTLRQDFTGLPFPPHPPAYILHRTLLI